MLKNITGHTGSEKKVQFGFVETRYYDRRIGHSSAMILGFVNMRGVKLGACYEPFATVKTYFDGHDPLTCCGCLIKKNEDSSNTAKYSSPSKLVDEKPNEFYNIHGLTKHTAPKYNHKERLKLLIESGVCVDESKEALNEQNEYLKQLYLIKLKEKMQNMLEEEIFKLDYKHFHNQREKEKTTDLLYKIHTEKENKEVLMFLNNWENERKNYDVENEDLIKEICSELKTKEKAFLNADIIYITCKLKNMHISFKYKELSSEKKCMIVRMAKRKFTESILKKSKNSNVKRLKIKINKDKRKIRK